jgi:hypothetical protein
MTWIVGSPIMFGYGFAVSDIRVTLANRQERDCLQKIYPVGQFIAAGFAGSVKIGFAMLETLSLLLSQAGKDQAWDPTAIAEWWPADARDVFSKFPPLEQSLQSHLMLIGVSPQENNGDSSWAKSHVYIFRSPDFKADAVPLSKVDAIGSGNFVEPCRQLIETISSDHDMNFNVIRGEQGHIGGAGAMLSWQVTSVLRKVRPGGISAHLHTCWVFRGRIVIKNNDYASIGRWSVMPEGPGVNERLEDIVPASAEKTPATEFESHQAQVFKMPGVAHTWDELKEILSAEGATAEGGVA